MNDIAMVVLASGDSRRFGEANKLLMPLGSVTVIEKVVTEAMAVPHNNPLLLITRYDQIKALFMDRTGLVCVHNPQASEGISASIRLAVQQEPSVDGYMFIPGDQVGLDRSIIDTILETARRYPDKIIVPTYDGIMGSPKVFPASRRKDLLSLKGDQGGKTLIDTYEKDVILVSIEGSHGNTDIDTPKDYARYREEFG